MRYDAESAGEKFFAELGVPVTTGEGNRLFEEFCEDFDAAMDDAYADVLQDIRATYAARIKALAIREQTTTEEENPSA